MPQKFLQWVAVSKQKSSSGCWLLSKHLNVWKCFFHFVPRAIKRPEPCSSVVLGNMCIWSDCRVHPAAMMHKVWDQEERERQAPLSCRWSWRWRFLFLISNTSIWTNQYDGCLLSVRPAGSDWSVAFGRLNVGWFVRRLLQKLFCTSLSASVCLLGHLFSFCCSEIPETAFYELFRID